MFKLSRVNRVSLLPIGRYWGKNVRGSVATDVENAISLRVMVLALVIVGILSTDIAAGTQFSFWAVPLSILGNTWSYYHRRSANVPVKFCIAIGMLIALGGFFGRLVGELHDTRLALAELLIQLQILHSFDMPRRKSLGYSIVIGLILLGVAATLSQTLDFAPMLLLFLAIALPTLVLNYRSQLGIQQLNIKNKKLPQQTSPILNVKFLSINFLIIVGLGLAIFAVLPRFPGYQIRSFPVSAPINVDDDFTGQTIINPGYVRHGRGTNEGEGTGSGQVQGGTGEPGSVDSNFYYGFNSQMNQNLRGEMTPQVVMRVRSQIEGFWRVLAFDQYTGQGWEISRNDDVTTHRRAPWSYQIRLPLPLFIGRSREIVQTYTVVSDLPNLIPAMAHPKEVYFPAPIIAVDPENGLRSPVGLSEGLTYTVVSQVPYRDRTLLGQASTKYPPDIRDFYLQIPPQIADRVRQRTEEIINNYNEERVANSAKTLDSPYEIALYLAQYLKQNYSIPNDPLGLPFLDEDEDLVEAFLFKHRGGYPDHFSTVLTVMLRSIGIPARLVAGFGPGQFNPFTGMYVVRNTDAYAMTEVYFPRYGWFAFDPIPNHPLIPPSVEDIETFSVLRQFWQWVAGWLPSPVTGFLNIVFGKLLIWLIRTFFRFLALFTQGWLGVLTGLIIATTTGFFGWFAWGQWRKWLKRRWLKKLPPMESLYQQMLQWLDEKGLGKHPAQTPLEYAHISHQQHPPATAQVIDEICQAYVGWRYGGQSPNLNRLQEKWQQLKKTNKY
jgi:transglutaminase-like putative cysteine protease